MDNLANQPSGFMPYNPPPCLGCGQNVTPGQTGIPMQSMPINPPNAGLFNQLPTGIPTGPNYGTGPLLQPGITPQQTPQGMMPAAPSDVTPIFPWNQPIPVTTESLQYMNGFMRTQIGRKVTVEFLIGTNTLLDRTGTLLGVGANYILINETETDDVLLCDYYSIKFVKFYY